MTTLYFNARGGFCAATLHIKYPEFAGGGTSGQGLGGAVSSKGATGHSAVPFRWVASGLQAVASIKSQQGRGGGRW